MRRSQLIGLGLVCATACVLTGCTSAPAPHRTSATVLMTRATTAQPSDVAGEGLSGTFTVNDKGCVSLGNSPIVAPAGSLLSADGTSFTIPGYGTLHIGDKAPPTFGGEAIGHTADTLPINVRCGDADYYSVG